MNSDLLYKINERGQNGLQSDEIANRTKILFLLLIIYNLQRHSVSVGLQSLETSDTVSTISGMALT